MGEKWSYCYSIRFKEILKKCVIFSAIFWKKVDFVIYHQFVYTEARRKQPMPKNLGLKISILI